MTEKEAWDMYYASIVGWTFHPGNTLELQDHLDLCTYIVDRMIEKRRTRWPDGQQQLRQVPTSSEA